MDSFKQKLLLVIYTFPPIGGAGVQRAVKFSKYLPLHGTGVTVLTVKDILYHVYDASMLKEVHESVRILRTGSFDPLRLAFLIKKLLGSGIEKAKSTTAKTTSDRKNNAIIGAGINFYRYFSKIIFFIDAQIFWLPFVLWNGLKAIKTDGLNAIVSMSQPNSLIFTCYLLSKLSEKPLILDMRDPWTHDPYFKPPTTFHLWAYRKIEQIAFAHAKELVVISRSMKEAIIRTHPTVADKVTVIPNGFDSADMQFSTSEIAHLRHPSKFVITYTGSLYAHHQPALDLFLDSLQYAIYLQPALRENLEVRLIGNVEPVNIARIKSSGLYDMFFLSGYVSHSQAVQYTYVTDILFLFIKLDLDATKDTITIPGKFFEYLGAEHPILFLGPKCEVTEILDETGQGWHPTLDANSIGTLLAEICTKKSPFIANKALINRYDRKTQAQEFSSLIFK